MRIEKTPNKSPSQDKSHEKPLEAPAGRNEKEI